MWRVLENFADFSDGEHIYKVGDEYPRKGAETSEERIRELSTGRNRLGRPLIENTPVMHVDTLKSDLGDEDVKIYTKTQKAPKTDEEAKPKRKATKRKSAE